MSTRLDELFDLMVRQQALLDGSLALLHSQPQTNEVTQLLSTAAFSTTDASEFEASQAKLLTVLAYADFERRVKKSFESFYLRKTHVPVPMPNPNSREHSRMLYRGMEFSNLLFALKLIQPGLDDAVKTAWDNSQETSALSILVQNRHHIAHGDESRVSTTRQECRNHAALAEVLVDDIISRVNAL